MIGLIFGCPMGDEVDDCPLKPLRDLPIRERIAIYEKMSQSEKDAITEHHEQCLARREGRTNP